MALRNLMNYESDEILRKKAKAVEKIDSRTREMLSDMAETMYHSNGAGLAGPQVGLLRRLVAIDIEAGLIKLINPVIVKSLGVQKELEGCLSVPGIYGKVERPEKVVVKALDENGKPFKITGTGLLARALCHEIDHLGGILFIDKVLPGSLVKENDLPEADYI